jgi:hypothetical protein
MDNALLAKVAEARVRYAQDPSPENLEIYRQTFRAFSDWILHGKLANSA